MVDDVPAPGLVHRGLVLLGRVLLVVAIALHLAGQVVLLAQRVDRPVPTVSVIDALTRIGVKPPCLILGPDAGPIAYPMECLTATTARHSQNLRTRAGVISAARHSDRVTYVAHQDKLADIPLEKADPEADQVLEVRAILGAESDTAHAG